MFYSHSLELKWWEGSQLGCFQAKSESESENFSFIVHRFMSCTVMRPSMARPASEIEDAGRRALALTLLHEAKSYTLT